MKKTLRGVMVATAATALLLTACGSSSGEARQQPKVTGALTPPKNNPQLDGSGRMIVAQIPDARAPEGNPVDAQAGTQYRVQQQAAQGVAAQQQSQHHHQGQYGAVPQQGTHPSPAQQRKKGGMFSWVWGDKQPEPTANDMPRRVPVLNQNAHAEIPAGVATGYEAAAPVEQVYSSDAWGAQQGGIIVAEELSVMDEPFTPMELPASSEQARDYPSLASVPPRPERLNAINERDSRMADMQAARTQSQEQLNALEAQVAADNQGSLLPQYAAQQEVVNEFDALVAADSQPPAPIEMAHMSQQPTVDSWTPVGQAAPQAPVYGQAVAAQHGGEPVYSGEPVQIVEEGEWISLTQDPAAQMAVPVEGVQVVNAPEVAAVSSIPVVAADYGEIRLTPPSAYAAGSRALPESRYTARRQAVYMQRYARQTGQY